MRHARANSTAGSRSPGLVASFWSAVGTELRRRLAADGQLRPGGTLPPAVRRDIRKLAKRLATRAGAPRTSEPK